jgi:hypothetical protein
MGLDELPTTVFSRLLAAIDGPIGLVLLLVCGGLSIALKIVWNRWHADREELQETIKELSRRLDHVQEERVDDARQGLLVLSNTSAVLHGIERQAKASWEKESPVIAKLDALVGLLQQQGRLPPATG